MLRVYETLELKPAKACLYLLGSFRLKFHVRAQVHAHVRARKGVRGDLPPCPSLGSWFPWKEWGRAQNPKEQESLSLFRSPPIGGEGRGR